MKVVILAGGFGTRLSEETDIRPKPMVEIGGKPILWHIQKIYASFGFKDFIIALGYKGEYIKRYYLDFHKLNGGLTINFRTGRIEPHCEETEDWRVMLVDTGIHTMTGGRIHRLRDWLKNDRFMVTYGDGVADINIRSLLNFHIAQNKIATISAVRPPARFGELAFNGSLVANFLEKPLIGNGWINGGFMVFEPEIFTYLDRDDCVLERDGLERLAADGQLAAYQHEGFWQCMDTLNDRRFLERLWESQNPPWRIWNHAVNSNIELGEHHEN